MTHSTGQFTCRGCYVLPLNNLVCKVQEKISFMTGSDVQVLLIPIIIEVQTSVLLHQRANYFFQNFSFYFRKINHLH